MISIIGTILGLIPGLSSLVGNIANAWFNSKVAITTAKIGGDTAVAQQLVIAAQKEYETNVTRLSVLAGSKALMWLIFGFATPWVIFEWKVIVWDTVLEWGTTSPIGGEVGTWGHIIIMCLFGSGTSLAVGNMYFNRKNQ